MLDFSSPVVQLGVASWVICILIVIVLLEPCKKKPALHFVQKDDDDVVAPAPSTSSASTSSAASLSQPKSRGAAVPELKLTSTELAQFKGENNGLIYVALGLPHQPALIYDITSHPSGRELYGPGTGYSVFAGRDASRALATMDLKTTRTDTSDLSVSQLDTLQQWINKFGEKYKVVGKLVN